MAVIDDFKVRFPEFDESKVDITLPGLVDVYPAYWGGEYDSITDKEIVLNLLAHLLVVQTLQGTGNPKSIQSRSVGSVSTSYEGYAATSERMAWFGTTKYGKQFLLLTGQRRGAVFV